MALGQRSCLHWRREERESQVQGPDPRASQDQAKCLVFHPKGRKAIEECSVKRRRNII